MSSTGLFNKVIANDWNGCQNFLLLKQEAVWDKTGQGRNPHLIIHETSYFQRNILYILLNYNVLRLV